MPGPSDVIQHAIVDVAQEPFAGQQVHQVEVGLNVFNGCREGEERHGTFVKRLTQVPGEDRDDAFSVRMVTHEQMVFDGSENQFKSVGDFPQC